MEQKRSARVCRWDEFIWNRYPLASTDPFGTDQQGQVDGNARYRDQHAFPNCPDKKRAQIRSKGLQYSCRCGWIDWGHAGGRTDKPSPGLEDFRDVWRKLQNFASQPRGSKGYVCYGTSQTKFGISTGITKCYYVMTGLSDSELKCAAWGIFKEVQEAFERHQQSQEPFNQSGFSPEDLTSDLILFLRATNPELTSDKIRNLCGVIEDVDDNLYLCNRTDWRTKNQIWSHPLNCSTPSEICDAGTKRMPEELRIPECSPSGRGVNWGPKIQPGGRS